MEPTRETVLKTMSYFDVVGEKAFLNEFANGRGAIRHYVSQADELYPVKAIWAASHNPPVTTDVIHTHGAIKGLKELGFSTIIDGETAEVFFEGKRRVSEVSMFSRNKALTDAAKTEYGYECMACGFDFESTYGAIGKEFIECHHIEPLSEGTGDDVEKTIADVAMLCANCHRMIHRKRPAMLVADLRQHMKKTLKAA